MRKYDIKHGDTWAFGADVSEFFCIAEKAGLTNHEIEIIIDMPPGSDTIEFAGITFERME